MDVEIEATGPGGAVKFRNLSRGQMRVASRNVGSASDILISLPIDGCGSIETTEISVRPFFAFSFFEGSKSTNPQQQGITGVVYEFLE